MKSFTRLPVVLVALLAVLALPASTWAAFPRGIPGAAIHDLLVLRTGDSVYGGFVALRAGSGRAARPLPRGLFDRGGHTLYVAIPQYGTSATSLVQAIDAASGRVLRSITVAGTYSTAAGDYVPGAFASAGAGGVGAQRAPSGVAAASGTYGVRAGAILHRRILGVPPIDTVETLSALSFNGRWLALRDATPGLADTKAVVLDTARMRVVASLHLKGTFGLDAISADGSSLYLIETLGGQGPQAYQVRLYDVRQARLLPHPLVEKGEASDIIRGVAYTRVWSPRGDWLFTLYVQPGRSGAFVHALGVQYRRVHCIMLNDQSAAADAAHYALAVAPDGSALYAVDPVLGHAIAIRGGLPYGTAHRADLGMRAVALGADQASAALSADGGTMYVATDRGVWAVDTRSLAVRATFLSGQMVTSVALSPHGQRLYALVPGQSITAVDPMRGLVLGSVSVPMEANANPSAIEQVLSQ